MSLFYNAQCCDVVYLLYICNRATPIKAVVRGKTVKMEQKFNARGFLARILGDQPTALQKTFFWLMVLSLLPAFAVAALFFFDAPIHTTTDKVCRLGMAFTIWLYPVYLFPLLIIGFRAARRLRANWIYFLCPLLPVAIFMVFASVGTSEMARKKPEGYDPSTFERINNSFAKDANHVYYCNEILKEADPASFRAFNKTYSADARHVWFYDMVIQGADPASFVAPSDASTSYLAHDAHDYYKTGAPLHVADMGSFKQVDDSWAVDNKLVYYIGDFGYQDTITNYKVPIGDYHTFCVLNHNYAVDAKQVYFQNKVVAGADPSSFRVLKSGQNFGQDKNRTYYEERGTAIRDLKDLKHKKKNLADDIWNTFHSDGTTVYNPELMAMPPGTDFETIHRVEPYRDWYADKNRVYYENRVLPDAHPQTFKVFPSHDVYELVSDNNKNLYFSYDGNRVYYRDSLILGVDIPSFVCGYYHAEDYSFAFDKNRYYLGKPNPRLEKLRQGKYE